MRQRTTRTFLVVLIVAVIALGGGYALKQIWSTATSHTPSETCTVGGYVVDISQAEVAAEMVGAVSKYRPKLPERAAVLVLGAGLQESKLNNIPPGEGDRDSVGVLQQRPSQGDWGTIPGGPNSIAARTQRLRNVGFATTAFLQHMVDVPHWRTQSLGAVVQAVQNSADPSGQSYAQHEPEAQALADALQGVKPAAITCDYGTPTLVASAAETAQQASEQLGINTPRATGPHTVTVPGAHWQTVAWFIANGDRLGIDRVAYDGKVWTRSGGWHSAHAPSDAVVATLHDLTSKK
jgi:hypothetical protein